jgi:hypothetical protein
MASMFSYRPPKSSIWGAAIRYRDPLKAKEKVNAFFATYFERLEPEWDTSRQFNVSLYWNTSRLPNLEWPPELLKPENQKWQRVFFLITGDRISFLNGLLFPISSSAAASYEFLARFAEDAPFKMSAKHFQVDVPLGKKGNFAWRKPDATITARLQEVIV